MHRTKSCQSKYWITPLAIALIATATLPIFPSYALANSLATNKQLISEQQAIGSVFNKIKHEGKTIVVNNRSHRAEFNAKGIQFKPQQGPAWRWQLQNPSTKVVHPIISSGAVDYVYKDYTERYLLKTNSIEQRFIIEQPYQAKKDLIIEGKINSKGKFETTATGWLWRDKQGVVSLGQVTVFDANGKILPATMHTEATFSRITVAANVLKTAVYPVTIDPEIGSNDFLIASMVGNASFDASEPDVSYNATNNEYLVVWSGTTSGPLLNPLRDIYGQRIDAATGTLLSASAFLISSAGGVGDNSKTDPAVSYNSNDNEYFVVWANNGNTPGLNGRFINAATGALLNGNDLTISSIDGAEDPAISYNAISGQYLVVWSSNDGTQADLQIEIYGQRFNATNGTGVGGINGFRISGTGIQPAGGGINAINPAISYNATNNEYLVVWSGGDPIEDNEREIYGQRINANTGTLLDAIDFRISDMGQVDGAGFFLADDPAVSYNTMENEYLVVWAGDDDTGSLAANEREIYGQRIDAATGAEIGDNDFRLSDMGPNGDIDFNANDPDVSYNASNNEYLVIWRGDDSLNSVDDEFEVFAQRINATTGAEIGDNDFRLSDIAFDVKAQNNSAVSYNTTNDEYLVVWAGDETNNKDEIFGQRFASPPGDNGGNGGAGGGSGGGGGGAFSLLSLLLLALSVSVTRFVMFSCRPILHT